MSPSPDGRVAALTGAERGVRATMEETLLREDMASLIVYAVSQPPRVSLNEVLVRPTGQAR